MRDLESNDPVLSGSLLVAHPGLSDPNFHRSVLLITAHSAEQGAIGVILNRPMNQTLGDWQPAFAASSLAAIPVYLGGPVATDELLLAAWRWDTQAGTFQLYFGVAPEKLEELLASGTDFEVRAFAGYSGWSSGQLEAELHEHAWIIGPVTREAVQAAAPSQWRELVSRLRPDLRFLALAPDDPSLN